MVKPTAPLMYDENGFLTTMEHPLTFDTLPLVNSEYTNKVLKMADGGSLDDAKDEAYVYSAYQPDAYIANPYEPQTYDTSTGMTPLVEQALKDTKEWMRMYRPKKAPPIVEEGPGAEGTGGNQGAGYNTFAGTLAGLSVLGTTLSNFNTTNLLGKLFNSIVYDVPVSLTTSTKSMNIRANIDRMTAAQQAQAQAVSEEYGPAGYTGNTPKGDFTFGPPLTQDEIDAIESEKYSELDRMEAEEKADKALAAAKASYNTPTPNVGPPGGGSGSTGNQSMVGEDDPSFSGTDSQGSTDRKQGGQIKGYQEGAMVEEQANTTMDTAGLGPMGLVDDMAGDQVTGVEDDLNLDTEEGAYVLNADAVELAGLKDLNQLVKDAIEIAIESDIPIPKSIDPTKKVPIKISNGEFVIPAILVPVIGLENLEKMNNRGLEYREKNREEEKAPPQEAQQQEAEQQDIPVEPSEVPSRGVPGEINLNKGGAIAEQMNRLM